MLVRVLDKSERSGYPVLLQLFPAASRYFHAAASWCCGDRDPVGAIWTFGQRDLKRLIAIQFDLHFGFIVPGNFWHQPGPDRQPRSTWSITRSPRALFPVAGS